MVGSFRLRFIATCERLLSVATLSEATLPSRGEPRLLADDLREMSAAFILAAAAREVEARRGDGLSCLSGGDTALCIARNRMGEEFMFREGGRELRSGGDMPAAADQGTGGVDTRKHMDTRMNQSDHAIWASIGRGRMCGYRVKDRNAAKSR
jgi:hypothetical protein